MKIKVLYLFSLLSLAFTGYSCSGESESKSEAEPAILESMDRRTQLRFKQYWVQGRLLYKKHCLNCHQDKGTGMAQLIPPLAGSDYLANPQAVACIIRHGLQGPLTVNGVEYNGVMPANRQLRPLEVAELVTYISNAWGNAGEFVTVQQAEAWLQACKE